MSTEEFSPLDRLLAWLDGDRLEAGRKYVQFQQELIAYLEDRGAYTAADRLADKALDRVDQRLGTSLLNEHFNSTEINDVPCLCRILHDEGAKDSPGPGRRIWELLSPADQSLVTIIAKAGKFDRHRRSRLCQALNEMLRRRDFYRGEDFNQIGVRLEIEKNSVFENVEADLGRGLTQLSQNEIELFNRRLLEAAFPTVIKRNLADTPDEEKLRRCKRYARIVLLEYFKEPRSFDSSNEEWGK
jgi:hypothetical protein